MIFLPEMSVPPAIACLGWQGSVREVAGGAL